MNYLWLMVVIVVFAMVFYRVYRQSVAARRTALIEDYQFPPSIKEKIRDKYGHLNEQQVGQVMVGLREYFQLCNIAGHKMVAMPSQAVDLAWHEFILFTKNYQRFCHQALGRFLHHTPAEAMSSPTQAQAGIKRAWQISCRREQIAPKAPGKLPLLFAMDDKLKIPDGFIYARNCKNKNKNKNISGIAGSVAVIYCAGDIGCGSGGDSGGGDSGAGDSGGGDGGGCGGS